MTSPVRLVCVLHNYVTVRLKSHVPHQESFESVQNWIEDVCRYAPPNVQLAVVGNKTDLREKQIVNEDNAKVTHVSKCHARLQLN